MASASLPSFVELMASLGLSADPTSSGQRSRQSSYSPSPSASPPLFHVPSKPQIIRDKSPAIVVSHFEPLDESGDFKRRASSGNIKASRFSPYSSAPRRGSLSAITDSQRNIESPRISASSSRRSSCNTIKSPPIPRKNERRTKRGSDLEQLNIAAASCTPISSYARRRSPHTSPTSPTFSHQRSRSISAELPSPVSLPTLPPMLAESFAAYSLQAASKIEPPESRSRSPCLSPMAVDPDTRTFVKHHQAGVRISSFHRQVAPVA